MGKTGGSVFAIAILAAMSLACAGSAVAPATEPTISKLVPDDAVTVTPRPDERTPTPDLSNALPSEEALEALMEVRNVGDVLRAMVDRDVEAVLQLIDWQPQKCGLPHGHTDQCPPGVEDYAELPMFNVGEAVSFWAREETLRPALAALLAEPVELTFASRFTEPGRPYRGELARDIYFIGVEGAPRAVGPSVLWDESMSQTGIFLAVDFAAEHPIIGLANLSESWSAPEQAAAWGLDGHEIITISQ